MTADATTIPPVPHGRLAARLGARRFIDIARLGLTVVDSDLTSLMVYTSILLANLQPYAEDWDQTLAFSGMNTVAPDSLREPISISSIARQLNLPFETTRRHVRNLRELGRCEAGPRGMIVPASELRSPRLIRCIEEHNKINSTFVRRGIALGLVEFDTTDVIIEDVRRHCSRLSLEFFMSSLVQFMRMAEVGPMSALILRAISLSNTEHLAGDMTGIASFTSLEEAPPDTDREPVTVYSIAKDLMIPYETVRRYVNQMKASGLIQSKDGALIVPREVVDRPNVQAGLREFGATCLKDLKRFAALGVGREAGEAGPNGDLAIPAAPSDDSPTTTPLVRQA